MLILACIALFAGDALAERLGMARGPRGVLSLAEAVLLWNVAVLWGHPEDAVAVALGVYAIVFAIDGRFTGAGWLFGIALAVQPLVVVVFPVLLVMSGKKRALGLAVRSNAWTGGSGPSPSRSSSSSSAFATFSAGVH
jgi:hypothetical protein